MTASPSLTTASLAERAKLVLAVEGMTSPALEQSIERSLRKLPGVSAKASAAEGTVRVEFDRGACAIPEIVRRLDNLGVTLRHDATAIRRAPHQSTFHPVHTLKHWYAEYRQLFMAAVGGLLLVAATIVHATGGPNWLRVALIIPAYVLTGWFTFLDTAKILWELRFDIDVLMFAAAFGAAALGHYEEGGLLLFLFALGGAGEEMAMDRARRAIQALARLAPETATVRDAAGNERLVRVAELAVGDLVVVRPFDRLPADGAVTTGASSVDQSPITGESVPVDVASGDKVFAGTINGEGLLTVAVTKLASESTLSKIVRMVEEAQASQSPTQQFTAKVEKFYVPLVLLGTLLLILLPPLLFHGRWSVWFYRAMAFLTAASPCALAIGTPAAVLSGIARAARGGVLVKGGAHLEMLGRVCAVAFDKTGTLTRGRPELTDVISLNGWAEDDLLALAAAVERHSSHPLAAAIAAAAKRKELEDLSATDVHQIPAQGVCATVDGRQVFVGKLSVPRDHSEPGGSPPGLTRGVDQHATDLRSARPEDGPALNDGLKIADVLNAQGKTTVLVTVDDVPAALLALADRPRHNAAATLAHLKRLGVTASIMLTGDRAAVAAAVAKDLGIDYTRADLLPEDKVAAVQQLKQKYGPVAMVGDGVNDAPAMATADVGIAMGGAGTDVALETADVALMADDLAKLPEAIGVSRFARKIITQNLVIALGVIAVLAPLAASGHTSLGIAVLFHEGSTVVVVLNALRVLIYRTAPAQN